VIIYNLYLINDTNSIIKCYSSIKKIENREKYKISKKYSKIKKVILILKQKMKSRIDI